VSKLWNPLPENLKSKKRNIALGNSTILFSFKLFKGCIDSCMLIVFGWGKDENLTAVIHQVKTRIERKQETECFEKEDDSSDEGKFKNEERLKIHSYFEQS
jgi:hypothetical protein